MATQQKSVIHEGNGANKTGRRFQTHIDISEENRVKLIELINQQLADTFDLYSQTKQAHWNVKGRDFFQLHELFDQLAETVLPFVDLIAERATALGGAAKGTARMAASATRLPEFSDPFEGMASVEALVERYAALAQSTRKAIDTSDSLEDKDTADLFTEVSRELDKALWFLEAHLQQDAASRR
jgi:starvation-inducible DNA-binding protein